MRSALALLLLVLAPAGVLAQGSPPEPPELELSEGSPVPLPHCRWVPTAARTLRLNDRNWATDLELAHTGDRPAEVSVALLTRGEDNRTTLLGTLAESLPPGSSVHLPDVVALLVPRLWRPWRGGLVVCSDSPGLEVASRTYLLGPDESSSSSEGIPGLAMAEAVRPGTVGHLIGLRQDQRTRSHLGLVNPSAAPRDVELRLLADDGNRIVVVIYDLLPYAQVQINNVLARYAGDLGSGRAEVRCAQGPVFAYATLIDNGTDDPSLVACRVTAD